MRACVALLSVMIACVLAACDESTRLVAPSSLSNLNGAWRLTRIANASVQHIEPGGATRFAVTFTDGRVQAKSDCNSCSGVATLVGDQLTVGPLACTRAFCTSAPLDSQFEQAMSGTHTVRSDATRLQLSSSRGDVQFERQP